MELRTCILGCIAGDSCSTEANQPSVLTEAVSDLYDDFYSSSASILTTGGECRSFDYFSDDYFDAAPTAASLAISTAFAVFMLN